MVAAHTVANHTKKQNKRGKAKQQQQQPQQQQYKPTPHNFSLPFR